MADGSITISTKLETGEIKEGLRKLKASLGMAGKEMNGIGTASTSAGKAMSKSFENAKAKVIETEAALRQLDMQREAIAMKKTEELSFLPYDKASLYEAVEAALNADKEYTKLGKTVDSLEAKLVGYKSKMNAAKEATSGSAKATGSAKRSMSRMLAGFKNLKKSTPPLTKSILSLANMFKLMVLRMAIRAAVNAMKAGFQDLAQYSGAFNRSMSDIKTSLLQVRNSIATAAAPAMQALVPIIEKVSTAFVNAMNVVAAFNARLFGGATTYIRATKAQTDYAASLNKTGKEAGKAKKSLAGFDEINVLSGADGGGTSTPGMPSPQDMFETVEIPPEIANFADKMKPMLDFFKTHLDDILRTVAAIATGMLAWKISKGFGAGLKDIKDIVGIALLAAGAVGFFLSVWDMMEDGVTSGNVTTAILSLAAIVGGLIIVFGVTEGMVGLLIGGFVMLAVGLYDWIKSGKLSTETFWLLLAAIAAVGIALAVLVGWPALLVAAVAGMALAIYKYWDEIKVWFANFLNYCINGINSLIDRLNKIKFSVPDWVPLIGGKSFGFNVKHLQPVQVPKLATGAVIPPNAEFLAVLGDQKNGRNLEGPESLFRKIVREESGNGGGDVYLTNTIVLEDGTLIKRTTRRTRRNGGLNTRVEA